MLIVEIFSRPSELIPDKGSYEGRAYIYDVPTLNKAPHWRIAELWSESNLQAEAAGRRLSGNRSFADPEREGRKVDGGQGWAGLQNYLVVRSEDFVTTEDRYEAAAQALIKAAQPAMDMAEMCCLISAHWAAEQVAIISRISRFRDV